MFKFFPKIYRAIAVFREAFGEYKYKLLLMTSLGFIGGLLGGVGIGAIIPLFSFISSNGEANDAISLAIKKGFSVVHLHYSLTLLLVLMGIIFLAKAIFLYIASYINSKESVEYGTKMRKILFAETMRTDWSYLLSQKIGYLTSVLNDDVQGASSIIIDISGFILTLTSLIMYGAVALNISAQITFLTFGIGLVSFFALKPLYYKVRRSADKNSETGKMVAHHVNQQMMGAKTVKSLLAEESAIEKSNYYFDRWHDHHLIQYKYGIIFSNFLEPLTFFVIIPLFLIYYHRPDFNIASFAAIIYLTQKMFSFMQTLQSRLNSINQKIPSLVNVLKYKNQARKHYESTGGDKPFVFNYEINFENVSFKYNEQVRILEGLNFNIKKGQTIGLIGPSGAGKTTVVDIFLRFLNPIGGTIKVDGTELSEINLHAWRKHIGYVSQDMFLVNDTIENNIKFYDESFSHEEVIEAAKKAYIYDFIIEQPDKFDSLVGERGLQLSAGQRQRIVFARILLRKPKILVLDEATSALDNKSEAAIQKAVNELAGKITIFMIAHRLSTVTNTDKILVLDDGRIIEQGKPEELLKDKNSYFYKISNINQI